MTPDAPSPPPRLGASSLAAGIAAGPLYLTVGLLQALLRPGFDIGRHPLSVLANGPGGWVQTLNFVVTGLLVLAAALAVGRRLRPQSRAASWCLGLFGLSMIVAAGFPADPMDGFPPGTPLGPPRSISPTGLMHFAAGGIGFIALGLAALLAGRALGRRNQPAMARGSYAAGVVVILGFLGGPLLSVTLAVAGLWLSVVVGFAWLAILCRHFRKLAGGVA